MFATSRGFTSGAGGSGFNTQLPHTKGVKNGTSGYLEWGGLAQWLASRTTDLYGPRGP